jgi:hypothetical protein
VVTVRGAVRADGTLTQSAETGSCHSFAAGIRRDRTFVIPSGPSTAVLGGEPFALEASILRYHGPGVYATPTFGDPTSTTLTVDLSSSTDPFAASPPSAGESATIEPDGSGRFTFSGWQDPAGRTESGTVSWRCSDQQADASQAP